MYKQIGFICVLTLSGISAYSPFRLDDSSLKELVSQQAGAIREKFRSYRDKWNVPEKQIKWNPDITTNEFLTDMCKNNQDGNYQIPDNCNDFCMCAGGSAYIWTCPGGGMYDAIPDECVYPAGPGQETCPWKSIWTYPDGVHCETLGQRQFWGNLTFPAVPEQTCGDDVIYCADYEQVGVGKCNPGFGYSKCFLACIEKEVCYSTDMDCSGRTGRSSTADYIVNLFMSHFDALQ